MPETEVRYPVVVIGASLAGVGALDTILAGLTAKLPAPVLVAQHVGPAVRHLDEVLGRRSKLPVAWAADGASPKPGHVYLCPPRHNVRLEPDGTLTVRRSPRRTSRGQIDELFASAAAAQGPGVLGLVLTGMGSDGTRGAQAIKAAGGTVVAQDELTSTAFQMPGSVIAAGAADLVLPLGEISGLLDEVVGNGRRLPLPDVLAAEAVFAAGGEMGRLMAEFDWSQSILGPVERWPVTLRTVLSAMLSSPVPMLVMWGRSEVQLYNDAYRLVIGDRHPQALGRPVRETWSEGEPAFAPPLAEVWSGASTISHDLPFSIDRSGRLEETFFTVSYSPLRVEGTVTAVLCVCLETTHEVIVRRRMQTLHDLAATEIDPAEPIGEAAACRAAAAALAQNRLDIPFALIYLDESGRHALNLTEAVGVPAGSAMVPRTLSTKEPGPWPVGSVLHRNEPILVERLGQRFPGLACAPWPEPPDAALVLPISIGRDATPSACIVLGLSPRIPFDDAYRAFLKLVAEHIAALLLTAREHRQTEQRMSALAELDRAKTELLANVSHEFRTPLTLMLLPLEGLLDDQAALSAQDREAVQLAHRNALRLLRLVNTLLDTARIEQAQLGPQIQVIDDLSTLTIDLAGVFRSAIERAGLELAVDCPPLDSPVQLDPEMWETIVLNLISNALKHTFAGEIRVALRRRERHVELDVTDTGVGIPEQELSRLFTRFHRVADTPSRSHEGSGIGLAHVQQLVQLHAGSVRARSTLGHGSRFTVWLPLRSPRRVRPPGTATGQAGEVRRRAFVEEAELWLSGADYPGNELLDAAPPASAPPGRRRAVLIVDDNPDMRAYLRRLLSDRYQITAAANGQDALDALATEHFDLVLTDVLMPGLDGIELLTHIRTDPDQRATPVILLTAVADPAATITGLAAGAHDYIVKPFTARELIARIEAQLALASLRQTPSATTS